MGIIRKIDKYIKATLVRDNAAITANDELIIVRRGNVADIAPELSSDWANYCIEWRVSEYTGYSCYKRRDLTEFWRELHNRSYGRGLVIKNPNVSKTHDILKDFNEFTLLDLAPEDVVDTPIQDGEYNEITISLTDSNLWFTGSLTVPLQFPLVVANGKQVIKLPLSYRLREMYNDPLDVGARYNYNLLTYNHTFELPFISRTSDTFSATRTNGTLSSSEINRIITELAKLNLSAVNVSTKNYQGVNLYGATYIYCGPTEGYANNFTSTNLAELRDVGYGPIHNRFNKARLDAEFVLVIAASVEYCGVLTSEPIFLHFNLTPNFTRKTISRPPVHYWPLSTDRRNRGTDPDKMQFRPSGIIAMLNNSGDTGFACRGVLVSTTTRFTTGLGFDIDVSKDFTLSFDFNSTHALRWGAPTQSILVELLNYQRPGDVRLSIYTSNSVSLLAGTSMPMYYDASARRQLFPHWTTITMVKSGNMMFIYLNGVFALMYSNVPSGIINAISGVNGRSAGYFREMRYFDYALDAKQVIECITGRMDPVVPELEAVPLPTPLHYWPLNGDVNNLGSSGLPLNRIFNYETYIRSSPSNPEMVDKKQYVWLPNTTKRDIGVELDITKDFTFAFDLWVDESWREGSNYGQVFANLTVSDASNFNGISCNSVPIITTAGTDPESQHTSSNRRRMSSSTPIRYQFVRKGDKITVYANGEYLWTSVFKQPSFNCINAYCAHRYVRTRNWAYYECALDEDQVVEETLFSFNLSNSQ